MSNLAYLAFLLPISLTISMLVDIRSPHQPMTGPNWRGLILPLYLRWRRQVRG